MSYRDAESAAIDPRYASADVSDPAPAPGTFPALLLRLNVLHKKSVSVNHHTQDVRSSLIGRFPATANEKDAPKPVPNGMIESLNEIVGEIEKSLASADSNLEQIWSKLGS